MIAWHRLFGIALIDFFEGTPLEVILEMDLSVRQQFLDVVILRKAKGRIRRKLPDGFEPLANHNLLTFKSQHEALDSWAIKELISHSVNYRKQVSPPDSDLLPEDQFQLFAVATRFPDKLAKQVNLVPQSPGTYQLQWGVDSIRVIVLSEVPLADHNLILNLFSSRIEGPQFAWNHLKSSPSCLNGIVNQVFELHFQSRLDMPYTKQDFLRDFVLGHLDCLKPEERLKGVSAEEFLKRLSAEERLKGLPAEERLKGLPAEERLKGLPADERMKGLPAADRLKGLSTEEVLQAIVQDLSPDQLEDFAQHLREQRTPRPARKAVASKRKPRRS